MLVRYMQGLRFLLMESDLMIVVLIKFEPEHLFNDEVLLYDDVCRLCALSVTYLYSRTT